MQNKNGLIIDGEQKIRYGVTMSRTDKTLWFRPQKIRIETFKASGPGGQHRNKRQTAVRIRHLSTGITAIATEHRSQARNKDLALKRLNLKLNALRKRTRPRIATSIPRASKDRRLSAKRLQSQKKDWRRRVTLHEI